MVGWWFIVDQLGMGLCGDAQLWSPAMARFSSGAPAHPPADAPVVAMRSGYFWVGVDPDPQLGVARGPMYVQWQAPEHVTQPYPIVLVHGGGGQGLDYLGTPDGRPGWATLLTQQGWVVYIVDRPGHGRAAYVPAVLGEMAPPLPVEVLKSIFVPESAPPGAMPFAELHTQWPGDGTDANDPALLQFLASGGPFAADAADRQRLEQQRLAELLDRIGPAFVVSNSLGGPAGFLIADARPDQVIALVQLEPVGPPFSTTFGPDTLQWGLAAIPMTFDPPATSPDKLNLVQQEPVAPGAPPVTMQGDPARRLANVAKVPIAVVSGEASVFRVTDPPLVEFLRQAGCDAVHIDLAEQGVHGNGHGAMFERNNAEVLAVVTEWMLAQLD
jgi:pimeloyl-ACP methyl ester carboxylesterase